MSKRLSFTDKIGKYIGFFAYSDNNNNNNNKDNIQNKARMAHPGPSYMNNNNNYNNNNNNVNNNNNNNNNYNNKNDVFDTKNFDKIDYIIQIPLIDNPNERQTRFLLAMDYILPPRDGLGIMDTALEHMLHYYDMKKVELIFCEMWNSVCLFIEFHDVQQCTNAYNQLFQFFKTIFYVEDLSHLEEMWICTHCRHYNQFNDNLLGKINSINDMASKRKNDQGDDYIYWCNRCRNLSNSPTQKIKYTYQKSSAYNNKNNKNGANNSKRDQIGSISKNNDLYRNNNVNKKHINNNMNNKNNNNNYNINNRQNRSSTDPLSPQEILNNNHHNHNHKQQQKPNWSNAKSQPIANTSAIYDQQQMNGNINNNSSFIMPAGNYGDIEPYKKPTAGGYNKHVDLKDDNDDDNDDDQLRTPAGTNLVLGQASGPLKFKIPNNRDNNNNYYNYNNNNNNKRGLNVMIPSKSLNDCMDKKEKEKPQDYRRGSGGSAITGISSSPEIVSPTNSIPNGQTPPKDIPFGLNTHGKKYSVDSQASLTSTASTVSAIDGSLDLCCTILENIDKESTNSLSGSNTNHNNINNNNNNSNYSRSQDLQQLELQKKQVVNKIAKLTQMLQKLQNTTIAAIDNHKRSMMINFNDMKQPENINPPAVYKNIGNDNADAAYDRVTPGGPSKVPIKMNNNNSSSQSNLIDYTENQFPLSSDPENNNNQYLQSTPHYDDASSSNNSFLINDENKNNNNNTNNTNNPLLNVDNDEDKLRTPAGADMIMGQAKGPISFKIPAVQPRQRQRQAQAQPQPQPQSQIRQRHSAQPHPPIVYDFNNNINKYSHNNQ